MPPRDPTALPTDPPIDPPIDPGPPTPPTRGRGCICAFCECKLTADGDVLKMSDTAKGYVLIEDELKAARADLKVAREENTALDTKLKALTQPDKPSGRGLRLGGS